MRDRIRQVADELADDMLPRGRADLIADFARPLPLTIISDLLGVPADNRDEFTYWANIYTGVSEGDRHRVPEAVGHMSDYIVALIDAKTAAREAGAGDGSLLDALLALRDEGDALTRDEILGMTLLLLGAGYETTSNLIGNGLLALLRHPDQLAALRADPARIGPALEELLRYDGPTKMTPMLRYTLSEVTVGGVTIPAGEPLMISLSAANRDPAQFADPDTLDVSREASGHVAFGHGVHFCLGSALARAEGEAAFTVLLTRFPELALAPEGPSWRVSRVLRSLRSLPVTFRASS
jgi:cytochrome P450